MRAAKRNPARQTIEHFPAQFALMLCRSPPAPLLCGPGCTRAGAQGTQRGGRTGSASKARTQQGQTWQRERTGSASVRSSCTCISRGRPAALFRPLFGQDLGLIVPLPQTESVRPQPRESPFAPCTSSLKVPSEEGEGGPVAAGGVTGVWSGAALPGCNKLGTSGATEAGLAASSITALTAAFSLFAPLCIISDWIRFN